MRLASIAALGFAVLGASAALAQSPTNADGTPRQRPTNADSSKSGKQAPAAKTTPLPTQQTATKPVVTPPVTRPVVVAKPIVITQPPHQAYTRDNHPYARHQHDNCQEKAFRLHRFERRAAEDGRISRSERSEIRALQYDLDRTCGRFRWNR